MMKNKKLEFTFGDLKIFIAPLRYIDDYYLIKIENKYHTSTYDLPKQYLDVLLIIINNLMV